jgi:hypothetical protein
LKADAIGWDLEAILEKRDCPAYDNGDENRLALEVFQMPVPSVCHKQIRANQQNNRRHKLHIHLFLKTPNNLSLIVGSASQTIAIYIFIANACKKFTLYNRPPHL